MSILFFSVVCTNFYRTIFHRPYLRPCLFSFKAPTCLDNINFTIDRWRRTKWRSTKWPTFFFLFLSLLSSESTAPVRKFYRHKSIKKNPSLFLQGIHQIPINCPGQHGQVPAILNASRAYRKEIIIFRYEGNAIWHHVYRETPDHPSSGIFFSDHFLYSPGTCHCLSYSSKASYWQKYKERGNHTALSDICPAGSCNCNVVVNLVTQYRSKRMKGGRHAPSNPLLSSARHCPLISRLTSRSGVNWSSGKQYSHADDHSHDEWKFFPKIHFSLCDYSLLMRNLWCSYLHLFTRYRLYVITFTLSLSEMII